MSYDYSVTILNGTDIISAQVQRSLSFQSVIADLQRLNIENPTATNMILVFGSECVCTINKPMPTKGSKLINIARAICSEYSLPAVTPQRKVINNLTGHEKIVLRAVFSNRLSIDKTDIPHSCSPIIESLCEKGVVKSRCPLGCVTRFYITRSTQDVL